MSNTNLPNIINDSSRFKLIPATSLKGATTISDPKFTMQEVEASIASWVEKQDSFWPEELTSDILTQYARLVFAPHWILDGRASGSWSANIGQDRTVYKTCSHCQGRGEWQGSNLEGKPRMFNCASCNGTGQTSDTVTDWGSQSGVATGHINGKVLENVANDTPIRCGKREFSAEESWLTEPFPDDILIFEPEAVGNETGLELAEKQLRKVVHDDGYDTASSLGQVRNFKLGYVNIESKEARTWLYPIYVSSYKYGEKEYLIEMDGITGKLHIEIPGTVRAKRRNRRIAYGTATILALAIFILIADFLVMALHPCGDLDNMLGNPSGCVTGITPSFPWGWDQASVSPDGELVAIRNSWGFEAKNYVELRQIQDGKLLHTLRIGKASQRERLTFSQDGKFLAIGDDNAVTLWRVADGKQIHTFNSVKTSSSDHPNYAWDVDFSPDGKMLAVGYHDGTVKIWRLSDYQLLHTLRGYSVPGQSEWNDSVRAIAFSPDGKLIVTGNGHGLLRLWQISSGKLLDTFDGRHAISGVVFSPDNKRIVSASRDGTIRLWDVSNGESLKTIQVDINNNEWLRDLHTSPDGMTVAISIYNQANNSRVQLWDIEKERRLQTTSLGLPAIFLRLRGMRNDIISFNYASDGSLFVIQSQDTNTLGFISLDRVFSPGDLFPVIAVREIEP